ncbi:hypothetical protein BH11BAC6_BH11BAC6_05680 [soil metagenome]
MERELLLAVKDKNYSKQRVECEIEAVKRVLPYIESYHTFCANNEVFDTHNHKLVTRNHKLKDLFETGVENSSKYYVICKN